MVLAWSSTVNELRLADPQTRQRQVQGPGYTAQIHYFVGKVAKQFQFLSFMGIIYKVLTCSKCETHLFSNTRTFVLDEFVNTWRDEKRGVVCLAPRAHHRQREDRVNLQCSTKRRQSYFVSFLIWKEGQQRLLG